MATILLFLAQLGLSATGAEAQPIDPVVAFSEDEQVVTVRYDKNYWSFFRPVIAPWKYRARGKVVWVATTGEDAM